MLSEDALIAQLKTQFPTHIGDDAAVIPAAPASQQWVITQDLLVEDVHFRRQYHDPKSLAHKALHVNLSDLAAMGATPRFIMLGLSIPHNYSEYIRDFLTHLTAACHHAQVEILGGDTTRSPQHLFISVTALGQVAGAHTAYRHTAHAGNTLCVAGHLGTAHIGLMALEHAIPNLESFKHAFLYPQARVAQGLWFSQHPSLRAMMDLSDGLFTDTQKLAKAAGLGAVLNTDQLNISPAFQQACDALQLDPITTQLIGGEDYGLLVAIDTAQLTQVCTEFEQQFHTPLQPVGQLHAGIGVTVMQQGKETKLSIEPFQHF
jgi:thiamine-monophosphate kinase